MTDVEKQVTKYSLLAFLATGLELAAIGASFALESKVLFNAVLIYGSPFYLAMSMLGSDSALTDANALWVGILVFHVIKYFFIFRAQLADDSNLLRTLAILFEASYLLLCGYYLYGSAAIGS